VDSSIKGVPFNRGSSFTRTRVELGLIQVVHAGSARVNNPPDSITP